MKAYERIFMLPPLQRRPFKNENWLGLLFEGSFVSRSVVYEAIRTASIAIGDSHLILTAMYGETGFETSIEAAWPASLAEFLELRAIGKLDFTPASELFGVGSGEWGCCFFFDEYFHIGGSKEYIENISELLGGNEKLKDDFYQFAAHSWPMGAGDRDAILCGVGW